MLLQAGDLFTVADQAIVNDLTEVVNKIAEITSLPDYINNDNNQSVVEICITRVTSCIRYHFLDSSSGVIIMSVLSQLFNLLRRYKNGPFERNCHVCIPLRRWSECHNVFTPYSFRVITRNFFWVRTL